MTRIFSLLVIASAAFAQSKLAPVDQAGYARMIASHKGRIVLVDFWATWCKPCRAEMPQLVELEKKFRGEGFDLVTVSADEPDAQAAALKLLEQNGVAAPMYVKKSADDDKFDNAIDPKWGGALPAVFLYDRTGKKVKSFIGETPVKDLEAAIAKIL